MRIPRQGGMQHSGMNLRKHIILRLFAPVTDVLPEQQHPLGMKFGMASIMLFWT
jgi:hypothetical protein